MGLCLSKKTTNERVSFEFLISELNKERFEFK